jgi:uncharacterized protein YaeQ
LALKPTIYKFKIMLSDMDRDYYEPVALTIAQHPSETVERMMVRVLGYCINAQERLTFTPGVCAPDEPDILLKGLDDQILLWIEVGEPSAEKIKKATRVAKEVKVYSFNSKAEAWWNIEQKKFAGLRAEIYRLDWHAVQTLASMTERTMDCSMTISGNSAYISMTTGECEVSWQLISGGQTRDTNG